MISSNAATTITAAMATPANFKILMSTFQTGQPAVIHPRPSRTWPFAEAYPGRGNGSKPPKLIRGAAKLCDLWHTSRQPMVNGPSRPARHLRRHCNEQSGRICGHSEDESDVRGLRGGRIAANLRPLPHPAIGGQRDAVPERRSRP